LIDVNREELQKYLNDHEIPNMIYYPVPIHTQKAYQNFVFDSEQLGVTKKLCQTVLSLPIHTEMDEEQLSFITVNILNYLKK
jgi:dTDP-4-amino-4,6-dideoxygalactose transaminase